MTRPPAAQRNPVTIAAVDPFERGVVRGKAAATGIRATVERYRDLFAVFGLDDVAVRRAADLTRAATAEWAPELAAEMDGTAASAGVENWQVVALNARTEILSQVLGTRPGECSAIAVVSERTVAAQTWDWHEELAESWHLHQVSGTRHGFVGITEYGILGKIGLNSAGVGVMLNILGHVDDSLGGVPVHLACARVLAEAGSLDEAIAILTTAPVSTSSAISIVTVDAAATVELSPHGASVLPAIDNRLVHTNHFLTPEFGAGEKPGLYDPDSQQRYALLSKRASALESSTTHGLMAALSAHAADGAEICCHPEPSAQFGQRWATLATVTMDPGHGILDVFVGGPAENDHVHPQSMRVSV